MGWIKTSLFLCLFGALKEFKPSESYVIEYLTGPAKNFTETEMNQELLPIITYSHLVTLFPVILLTDFLRYKPVIILCGLSGSCVFIIMIFAETLWEMCIVEMVFGLFCTAEIAYFAYIYAKVDKEHFQAVSSYTRVALLVGKFASSVTAQIGVSLNLLDYQQLNFLTIIGVGLATIWAFFLPSVGQSVYFHRKTEPVKVQIATIELNHETSRSNDSNEDFKTLVNSESSSMRRKIINAYRLLWKDFLLAYSNWYVIEWTLWWIFATSAFLQIVNYIQVLWQETTGEGKILYNGAIDASYTILGALAAFAVGKLRLDWSKIGEAILSIFSMIQGILILVAARTDNIWISYTVYVGFGVIYQAMITVTSAEVAKNVSEDSYGLIFGTNTLMALLLQSALTFAVSGNQGFALTIRTQYLVYGYYFIALGVSFMLMAVYTKAKRCRSEERHIPGTVDSTLSVTDTKATISSRRHKNGVKHHQMSP